MVVNKLDAIFQLLANNQALYQQLIEAVEAELLEAKNRLNDYAVQALYHPDKIPQACGQGGAYQSWSDILSRLQHFQHK